MNETTNNEQLFNRFCDRGVFRFEIYHGYDGKIRLCICPPDSDAEVFYKVSTFLDIARSLKEYANMYLKDDEGE